MTEQDEELYYFHNIMKDLFDNGGNQVELDTLLTVLMADPEQDGLASEDDKQFMISFCESLENLDYSIEGWGYTESDEQTPMIYFDVLENQNSGLYHIGVTITDLSDILLDYQLEDESISTCFKRIHCALTDPNFPKPFFNNMVHWALLKRKIAAL